MNPRRTSSMTPLKRSKMIARCPPGTVHDKRRSQRTSNGQRSGEATTKGERTGRGESRESGEADVTSGSRRGARGSSLGSATEGCSGSRREEEELELAVVEGRLDERDADEGGHGQPRQGVQSSPDAKSRQLIV